MREFQSSGNAPRPRHPAYKHNFKFTRRDRSGKEVAEGKIDQTWVVYTYDLALTLDLLTRIRSECANYHYHCHLIATARLANFGRWSFDIEHDGQTGYIIRLCVARRTFSSANLFIKVRAPGDRIDNPINPGTISWPSWHQVRRHGRPRRR